MSLKRIHNPKLAESVWWNLFLITIGSAFYALGVQAIALSHKFVTGGLMGVAMLGWYYTDIMTVPIWYLLVCIPVFVFGWFFVGRIFLLYSIYATVCTTIFGTLIDFNIQIDNQLYAAVATAVLMGTGSGIMLRSLGSGGGTDIICIALRERWNISVGVSFFLFNILVFLFAAFKLDLDIIIASTIMLFINSAVMEYVLGVFSNRKMVIIISNHGEQICEAINLLRRFGVTYLKGKGGYSGSNKEILLTVTSNVYIKQLENVVFGIDENAIFVVENTFYVSGGQFSRKIYK